MLKLRSKNGKHIVTHNGDRFVFPTLHSALTYVMTFLESHRKRDDADKTNRTEDGNNGI